MRLQEEQSLHCLIPLTACISLITPITTGIVSTSAISPARRITGKRDVSCRFTKSEQGVGAAGERTLASDSDFPFFFVLSQCRIKAIELLTAISAHCLYQ